MTGFEHTLAAIPGGSTRRTYGTAFFDGAQWFAEVGGNLLTCRWLDPIQPLQGGKLVVDISTDEWGQSTALVIGGYTDQPRPSTGHVTGIIPAGPATLIAFTGQDGVDYTAERFIGSYDIGDIVLLDWAAGQPSIIGKVPSAYVPPVVNAPEPPAQGSFSGTQRTPASASDTWWGPGGWGSYATSVRGGEDVYSGAYYSGPTTGAWFYGPANTILQGRNISQARFRIPARLNAGSYNAAATIHLYAHEAQSRPGGDVARIVGPFDVTLPARYNPNDHIFTDGLPPGWVILPSSFHAALVNGGGISISGDPYVGLQGRLKDPDSGKLELDWNHS